MKVVIAGGGTAGHVTPALALGETLREAGHEILFVGTERGIEARLVPAAGFELVRLPVSGFDRSRPLSLLSAGAKALRSTRSVARLLRTDGAGAVVGMGGYVSVPAAWAARSAGVPLVLHEQNIVLGLAHRVSKRFAAAVAVSFEETLEAAGPHGVHTGNPVPASLRHFDRAAARARGMRRWDLEPGLRTVLIFGGSLGAQRLNQAAPGMAELWSRREELQILHIRGSRSTAEGVAPSQQRYRAVDWVEDMTEAYGVADVAVCRGGATTIAELCATATPSIIVPYPHHRDRQQERHARVMTERGAASMLPDEEVTPERLALELDILLADEQVLGKMAEACTRLARPSAADDLAHLVLSAAR